MDAEKLEALEEKRIPEDKRKGYRFWSKRDNPYLECVSFEGHRVQVEYILLEREDQYMHIKYEFIPEAGISFFHATVSGSFLVEKDMTEEQINAPQQACTECGTLNDKRSEYCTNCGKKLFRIGCLKNALSAIIWMVV